MNNKNIYLLFIFENNIYYELEINQFSIILYSYTLQNINNNLFHINKYSKNLVSKYIIKNIVNFTPLCI